MISILAIQLYLHSTTSHLPDEDTFQQYFMNIYRNKQKGLNQKYNTR